MYEQQAPWVSLGNFTASDLDIPGPGEGQSSLASPTCEATIRNWEAERVVSEVEWSLVVLADGEAIERRGKGNRTSFEGVEQGFDGAVLSHTHPRGFPPSGVDIDLALRLPAVLQFRVARFGRPTIVMRRRISKTISQREVKVRADVAFETWQARDRAFRRAGALATELKRAEYFWDEIKGRLGGFGLERWEENL